MVISGKSFHQIELSRDGCGASRKLITEHLSANHSAVLICSSKIDEFSVFVLNDLSSSSADREPSLPQYSRQREGDAHVLYLYGEEQ